MLESPAYRVCVGRSGLLSQDQTPLIPSRSVVEICWNSQCHFVIGAWKRLAWVRQGLCMRLSFQLPNALCYQCCGFTLTPCVDFFVFALKTYHVCCVNNIFYTLRASPIVLSM